MPAAKFQVMLSGHWKDYEEEEDKLLKRAFMAGHPGAKFSFRGQEYQYDFKKGEQRNTNTNKTREIRPPYKWKPPAKPIVPAGPTTVVKVKPNTAGTVVQVEHPKIKGQYMSVSVPASAKPGQAMLVPVPAEAHADGAGPGKTTGTSTGAKVAMGVGGAALVAGAVLGGAAIGDAVATHGVEGAAAMAADGAADAGAVIADAAGDAGAVIADGAADAVDAVGDFAIDAGDFIVDAADGAGDFIMDLF
eukprot:gnl/TRDRNA2_/TRDRNA2_84660_c0_seq1.p1 gnl/TRDRNA2_/TRDRNA2_84660_c0~~gnl/TRDRNA2_/TRDRNA2_84660_c0_seq1.p1  ORF type:complete len:247 (-),score=65.04 gnl/TRDRNA2_/TRDRNA2_84660_c0_seq1:55-795(-)